MAFPPSRRMKLKNEIDSAWLSHGPLLHAFLLNIYISIDRETQKREKENERGRTEADDRAEYNVNSMQASAFEEIANGCDDTIGPLRNNLRESDCKIEQLPVFQSKLNIDSIPRKSIIQRTNEPIDSRCSGKKERKSRDVRQKYVSFYTLARNRSATARQCRSRKKNSERSVPAGRNVL